MPERPLRLGLTGTGPWGRNLLRTIQATPGVRLARLASRRADGRALAPDGCLPCADWRDMISAGDLDGLVLAVPAAVQTEIAEAAIAAHLPLVLEKPVARSAETARRLLGQARDARVSVLVDHTDLHNPAFAAMLEARPRIGPLSGVMAEFGRHGPFRDDLPALWDWPAHPIAACVALAGGTPTVVEARARAGAEGGSIFDVVLALPGDVRGTIMAGNGMTERKRRFVLRGRDGVLAYDDTAAAKLIVDDQSGARPAPLPHGSDTPLEVLIARFRDRVRAGATDVDDLRLGLRVVETLEAVDARLQQP